MLACLLVLSAACTAAPVENTVAGEDHTQLSTAESVANDYSTATEVPNHPIDISQMSDEDIVSLARDVFSCNQMPSSMEWHDLVALSNIMLQYPGESVYTLGYLLHSFDVGQNANATTITTIIPMANIAVADFSGSNMAQWLSWVSSCYERTYGHPIFWAICPETTSENGDPAFSIAMTCKDESFLYGLTESYTGKVLEVYPDFPAYSTPTSTIYEMVTQDDDRFLTVEGDSVKSYLTCCTEILSTDSTGRIYVTEDREYHQNRLCVCIPFRNSLYSDELMYIPYKNTTLPIFSTEFLHCSNEEHQFLDHWLNPLY